jgi:hypothetical protein
MKCSIIIFKMKQIFGKGGAVLCLLTIVLMQTHFSHG